jgi:predicted DNA-binding transcriptional regulator AlpA
MRYLDFNVSGHSAIGRQDTSRNAGQASMPRFDALPPNLAPRGLKREAAAQYVGVSVGKFDQMTKDGRMPKPIRIDGRKVWDRFALDRAFEALGGGAVRSSDTSVAGSWDDYINGPS